MDAKFFEIMIDFEGNTFLLLYSNKSKHITDY